MASSLPDASSTLASAADQVRRLTYLHDAVELYSRTSPSLAAWFGLQFVERAHEDGVTLNDAVTKTICTKCGSLLVPAVTRRVAMHGKGRAVSVQQECTRCRQRVVVQGKVVKLGRDKVPMMARAGVQGSKKQQTKGSKAQSSQAGTAVSGAAKAPNSTMTIGVPAVSAASKAGLATKAPGGAKRQQQLPGPKGKAKAATAKSADQKSQPDEELASRRSMSKKKSTLRGLLSLQKKNEADAKSLSLHDFLSNL